MRGAYAALVLCFLAGLGLATAVFWGAGQRPVTVAALLGVREARPELDARRANAVAALTAECMRRRGLLWQVAPEPAPDVPDPSLDPVAWADRWGFGVSTMIDRPAPIGAADQNIDALALMPAAEQDAHRIALHGSPGHPGCHEISSEDVYGLRERLLQPIRAELNALDAAIEADPGTAKALAIWRGCVAEVSSGLATDRRSLPGALIRRFADRTMATGRRSAMMRALQADERRVAGVIARCEVAYSAARTLAAARHEAAFINAHREAIVGIGAAIRSAEAALPTIPP